MVTTTKVRILEEAAKLFTEKGYEATSVQDVAQALGLSKAALYHHFRSKEEILLAISLQALEGLVRAGEEALAHPDPKEALLRFMEAHARYFEENYPFFVTMLQGIKSLSPENRALTNRLRDRHEANLRAILRRGVEAGVFRPVDVALTGRAVLSLLNWMIRWFRPGGPMRAVEVARAYHDLILRGLEDGSTRAQGA
ncbi:MULTISPECIES: TetR/AcrR family transcriptional regulator [Thermus]|uniref:TetR family transcriptional regulator n=2 Tax=Thermus TaxID=270 RepID=A0A1J0LQH4_THEBO|nr:MULTISPECIES: TetR/AcrR family transcriptional regulator [Thermus]APD08298.1 TetR family transcriptional regulator [Thermus brockianus]WCM39688.1 TetR family transcriptional regulator [Thermus antranikianii]